MFKKLFTAAWVALLFTFCQLAAAATNVSVTATPTNPTVPATVTLAVSGDTDGNPIMVTKVEYFNGTTSLGVSAQSPFTLTLNGLAAGTYQISVKVTTTDPANPVLQSAPLAVTVGTAPGAVTAYFIHTDQLNTPRAITDGSGNLVWQWDSDPFGRDAANEQPAGHQPLTFDQRFPGQQFDRESNLHYNYFRDYDPSIGRYIESDPIGLEGGVNTYSYGFSNPTSNVDPNGLFVPPAIAIAVAVGEAVAANSARTAAINIARAGVTAAVVASTQSASTSSPERNIWPPEKPSSGWVCKARADCNDNIPGNCPDDPKKRFAFGGGAAMSLGEARNAAKSNATSNLQCQPKHVSCKCTSSKGEPYSGGC